ncbi:MAG: membrane dipeptidase, partial [Anaerolineae bacterium]|nr:membrane dipeptidase [Anaerolineae bacterium]
GFCGAKVQGLDDVTHLPRLTAGLVERGYGEEDVKKILGGNFMRVFREVVG